MENFLKEINRILQISKRQMSKDNSSFSFARPKENEPKEKGARENGSDSVGSAPPFYTQGDFNKRWSATHRRVCQNHPFRKLRNFSGEGRCSIFARGIKCWTAAPMNSIVHE